MLLRRSVRSTIGMARDNSTCSTLVTSCMPWDSTSPRRSACKMVNKKKRTRNSPASTKLSPWSTLPWRPPKTTATTMTTLNCANCTTKTKMEPWCWLNLKTSCPTWVRYENSLSKSGYVNYIIFNELRFDTLHAINHFYILADEIPKEDTLALLAELADPEDEDGFFPYTPFLDRLCGKA